MNAAPFVTLAGLASIGSTPGGHTWGVWRRSLASIAPLLFKPTH